VFKVVTLGVALCGYPAFADEDNETQNPLRSLIADVRIDAMIDACMTSVRSVGDHRVNFANAGWDEIEWGAGTTAFNDPFEPETWIFIKNEGGFCQIEFGLLSTPKASEILERALSARGYSDFGPIDVADSACHAYEIPEDLWAIISSKDSVEDCESSSSSMLRILRKVK
jgi:hypothetical protein